MSEQVKSRKLLASLERKKIRDKTDCFLVEGIRFVSEIPIDVEIVLYAISDSFEKRNPFFSYRENVEKVIFGEREFRKVAETVSPQGIVAVCRKINIDFGATLMEASEGVVLVLDGIKDPGNFGTIIRTADAAGIKAIITSEDSVDLYNPKVLRSTMGSVFNVNILQNIKIEIIVDELRKKGFRIIGASLNAERCYYQENLLGNVAFIIGSEATGISQIGESLCDSIVKIPIAGKAESLNVGVATAIIVYEALRQSRMR